MSNLQGDLIARVKKCFGDNLIITSTTAIAPREDGGVDLIVEQKFSEDYFISKGLGKVLREEGIDFRVVVDSTKFKELMPLETRGEIVSPVRREIKNEPPALFKPVYATSLRNPGESFITGNFNKYVISELGRKVNQICGGSPIEPHICLVGTPGCGKSTLLSKVAGALAGKGKWSAYLDLNWLSNLFSVLYSQGQKPELSPDERGRIMHADVLAINCLEGLFGPSGTAREGCQRELLKMLQSRSGAPFIYTYTGTETQFQEFLKSLRKENADLAGKLAASALLVRSPSHGEERQGFISDHLTRTHGLNVLDGVPVHFDSRFPPDYSTRAIVDDLATIVRRVGQQRLQLTSENLIEYSGSYQLTFDYGSDGLSSYDPTTVFKAVVSLLPGGYGERELKGKNRNEKLAYARHLGIYAMRNILPDRQIPSPVVGKLFGRNHSLVLHAEERIKGLDDPAKIKERDQLITNLKSSLGIPYKEGNK